MDIKQLREQIDNIDQQIWALLDSRFCLVGQIAEQKSLAKQGIDDETRENQILNSIENNEFCEYKKQITKLIINCSKHYQKRLLDE